MLLILVNVDLPRLVEPDNQIHYNWSCCFVCYYIDPEAQNMSFKKLFKVYYSTRGHTLVQPLSPLFGDIPLVHSRACKRITGKGPSSRYCLLRFGVNIVAWTKDFATTKNSECIALHASYTRAEQWEQ